MLDYRPDLDPRTPGLLTVVDDMIPSQKGYKVAHSATAHTAHTYTLDTGEAYPNKLFASRWLSTPGGIVIVGSNKRLSVYDYTNGFINVSKAGDYSLGSQTFQYGEDAVAAFDLCAYGDVVIAANKSVTTQKRSALDLTSGTLFSDLTGAPAANTCCVARNFLFLGNCGDWSTVTGAQNIVGWSAFADYTDWTVNPTVTQASYAQFSDTPGPITCVRPFRDGVVVFKANAMYYGRYVGAGTNSDIWDFERVSDEVGCMGHRSVADIDTALVFASRDDLYIYDGTRPQSITQGIYEHMTGLITTGSVSMRVGHDRPNTSVWFGAGASAKTYVWNYKLNRWGRLANTNKPVFCETNVDDFRKVTLSTVTGGAQSFTTTTDHYNLHTLTMDQTLPKNRNTTRSTSASVTTGYVGDPVKLQTLANIHPIFNSPPTTVSTFTAYVITSRVPGSGTSTANVKAMNANYRIDVLDQGGMTSNYFSVQLNAAANCELMDVNYTFRAAGER